MVDFRYFCETRNLDIRNACNFIRRPCAPASISKIRSHNEREAHSPSFPTTQSIMWARQVCSTSSVAGFFLQRFTDHEKIIMAVINTTSSRGIGIRECVIYFYHMM